MSETLIRYYLKKKGLDDQTIESILKSTSIEEVAKTLDLLGVSAEALSKAPPEARGALAPVAASIISSTMSGTRRDRFSEIAETIYGLKMIEKMVGGNDVVSDFLVKYLEEQKKAVEELKQKLDEKEKQELYSALEAYRQEIEEVKKKLEEMAKASQQAQQVQQPQQKSEFEVIKEARARLEELVKLLKDLGYDIRRSNERNEMSVEEMVKRLQEMGYEVKRTTITEEQLREMIRRIRKKAYKEAMKKAKVQSKLVEGLLGIGTLVLDKLILPSLAPKVGAQVQPEIEEAVNRRLAEIVKTVQGSSSAAQTQVSSSEQGGTQSS